MFDSEVDGYVAGLPHASNAPRCLEKALFYYRQKYALSKCSICISFGYVVRQKGYPERKKHGKKEAVQR